MKGMSMLTHPTLEKLRSIRLFGMASALQEQLELKNADELCFEERLGLLVDRELTNRENKRFSSQLKKAQLRQRATLEDLDYSHPRGLDKSLIRSLASCQWLKEHRQLCITGATGTGKTYLACAFAHQAIRQGYTARYHRTSRLLQEFTLAKGDGRYLTRLQQLAKTQLLILDDWGIEPLGEGEKRILLEVLDDRFERSSTLIASQLPTDLWHPFLADPTLADAILDRILHSAYRIELKGESLRKLRANGS
jgi:DNA replication protein DnaC